MVPLIVDRFWNKVLVAPQGCWAWLGAHNLKGYGQFKLGGKQLGAHRVAWELVFGEILTGLFVCHTCDNPGCVNPAHLFLGTNMDNVNDRDKKKRNPRGVKHGMTKLNQEQVMYIRTSNKNHTQLANELGVTDVLVGKIRRNELWKELPKFGSVNRG